MRILFMFIHMGMGSYNSCLRDEHPSDNLIAGYQGFDSEPFVAAVSVTL